MLLTTMLNFFDIHHMRGCFLKSQEELFKCFTSGRDSFALKKFLNFNPEIIIVPCDKTKNITILYKTDYFERLYSVFDDKSKFVVRDSYDLDTDLDSIRELIRPLQIVK